MSRLRHWMFNSAERVSLQAVLLSVAAGGGLGFLGFGALGPPMVIAMLPVLALGLTRNRLEAFACALGYMLVTHRTLPHYAGTALEAPVLGWLLWLLCSVQNALVWGICRPNRADLKTVFLGAVAAFVVTLLPPVGLFSAAHPLIAWGYLLPGWSWVGVALAPLVSAAAVCVVRAYRFPADADASLRRAAVVSGGVVALIVAFAGSALVWKEQPGEGRVAGRVGGVQTQWGATPAAESDEVLLRAARMGRVLRKTAGGPDGLDVVVFPEGVLSVYDPLLFPVLQVEVLRAAREAGQTLVVGASLPIGRENVFQNVALIFRPDGSSAVVAARQSVPVAMWHPWRTEGNYPSDWGLNPVVSLGGGVRARVMLCYEEFVPFFHLLGEASGDQSLVVGMANSWAAGSAIHTEMQMRHTQGMARLFGHRWIRSENLPLPPTASSAN